MLSEQRRFLLDYVVREFEDYLGPVSNSWLRNPVKRAILRQFLCGGEYNIADMAVYSWYGQLVLTGLYESKEFLQVDSYAHLLRGASEVHNRPAVKRGRKINRASKSGLMERHAASDFDHLESR